MKKIFGLFKIFRRDALILAFAMRHSSTPARIKGMLLIGLLYIISPVDIVPDAIPLVGIVDDAIVLPTAIAGLTSMLPSRVRRDCEHQADLAAKALPILVIAAGLLIFAWLALILSGIYHLLF